MEIPAWRASHRRSRSPCRAVPGKSSPLKLRIEGFTMAPGQNVPWLPVSVFKA
jgi:hypothetical protein